MKLLTVPGSFTYTVSSVQNRSAEFSGEHMFNEDSDSCWTSGQNSPQSVSVTFKKNVVVSSIEFMFQGGFVGQDANIEIGSSMKEPLALIDKLELIQDNNSVQAFDVNDEKIECKCIKITFESSTDFYGRITLYSLRILGVEVDIDKES